MIATARSRLLELQAIDENRKAKAAALNDLEAYIYKIKNRLLDDETVLSAISTAEQRQAVIDTANAAEEWLYDDGRDATVSQYQAKMKEISDPANAIFLRFTELEKRDAAVKKVKASLQDIKTTVNNNWTAESKPQITEEEKASLLSAVAKVDAWIEEKAELQLAQSPYDKPVFLSSEVLSQLKPVMLIYDKLVKKPKPAPVVIEKEKNATAAAAAGSNDTSTTDTASDSQDEDEPVKVQVETEDESKKTENADEDGKEEL